MCRLQLVYEITMPTGYGQRYVLTHSLDFVILFPQQGGSMFIRIALKPHEDLPLTPAGDGRTFRIGPFGEHFLHVNQRSGGQLLELVIQDAIQPGFTSLIPEMLVPLVHSVQVIGAVPTQFDRQQLGHDDGEIWTEEVALSEGQTTVRMENQRPWLHVSFRTDTWKQAQETYIKIIKMSLP